MKRIVVALFAVAAALAARTAWAQSVDPGAPIYNGDKGGLNIYGRAQMMGTYENVPDPKAAHNRVYLFLDEARLGVKGRYEDAFKYELQMDFGGESINGSNTNMSLLDAYADVPFKRLGENTIVKIGQYRVPYSREALTDTGYMEWTNRSIANYAAFQGRDYGLAVQATHGNLTGTIGTFTGGGRNVPQRYLPENIGVPYLVARVGYNDGADEDIYHVMGIDRDLKRDTKAFYINGIYMQDTRIGHSTSLAVHTIDDNVLIDSNFNPYLKQGDATAATGALCSAVTCERGNLFFVGTDGVIRRKLGQDKSLQLEYEGNWGGYQNRFGVLHVASGRAQGEYQSGPFEIGLRYGILHMDNNAGFTVNGNAAAPFNNASFSHLVGGVAGAKGAFQYDANMGVPIHEVTPSITWHIRGQNMKVVASLPIFINAPLWIDNADGVYVFTDPTPSGAATLFTAQDSVLTTSGNNTVRRTIPEGRLMFQFMF